MSYKSSSDESSPILASSLSATSARRLSWSSNYWSLWESKVLADVLDDFKHYLGLRHLKKQVKDLVFGYGPLEDLLRLPTISEIMVVDSSTLRGEAGADSRTRGGGSSRTT